MVDMSPINKLSNFDVVVIGAGPGGISTSCMIRALNPDLRICVLDKHEKAVRKHGLKIRTDSIEVISVLLKKTIDTVTDNQERKLKLTHLLNVFNSWSGNFVRTSTIEENLLDAATSNDVTVLRGKEYRVKEKYLESLLGDQFPQNLSERVQSLYAIFKDAKIVIGADGAHSVVRKVVMQDTLVGQELIRHVVELKFQTPGSTISRSILESSILSSKHGLLTFESMSKSVTEDLKPATLHVFVPQETFAALRVEENGVIKGVFGNSWTLKDLSERFKSNPYISKLDAIYQSYIESLKERNGACIDEKISTIVINIYRSERAYCHFKESKHVLLIGDAESGIVLEGGFNKCLKGVAACAKAVDDFFKSGDDSKKLSVLETYQFILKQIFEKERAYAKTKYSVLKVAEKVATSSAICYETSALTTDSSTTSCAVC